MATAFSKRDLIKLYVVYCVCMDSEVFGRLFGGLSATGAQVGGFQSANPIMLLFSVLLLGGTAALFVPIFRQTSRLLLNVPWLTGLYLWSALSVVWAVQPSLVIRLGAPLFAYMLCGAIAAHYLSTGELATLLGKLVAVIAGLSLLLEVLAPIRGIAPGWTGVYGEKNHLGMGMGVGILALLVTPGRWTPLRVLRIVLCGVLLVGSQSTTAMSFVAVCGGLFLVLRLRARLRPLAVSLLLALVVLPLLVVPHAIDRAFAASGKTTNLTGRDVIWQLVYEQWKTRPILGFGYANFWTTEDDLVQQTLGWNPNSSHNGFLETAVSTGVIGEIFLLGTLGAGLRLARQAWRREHRTAALWLLLASTAMLIDDLTEADFMQSAPLWFTYCLALFATYAELRRSAFGRVPVEEPREPMALRGPAVAYP